MTDGPAGGGGPLEDPLAEVVRIVQATSEAGIAVRAVGGVAIALRAPGIRHLFPQRRWHDLDVATGGNQPRLAGRLEDLGYVAERRFNKLNGSERLLFHDPGGRRLDVFVDRLRMCHTLELAERLTLEPTTLPLADLLLMKLQIVELTERDRQDLVALLAEHPLGADDAAGISLERIASVCGADWGWWRTATATLDDLLAWLDGAPASADAAAGLAARGRARELRERLGAMRRSWRWRMRSVVGERLRWYDLPEEVR